MSTQGRDSYSSNRDSQIARAREIDQVSTALIDFGVKVVKRNPIKVGLYFIGILICLFFNGLSISPELNEKFENQLASIDYGPMDVASREFEIFRHRYYQSKGWFWTCNDVCQSNKLVFESASAEYAHQQRIIAEKMSDAKSNVGIFSKFGVAESRNLFWERFGQGKAFATRQSKYDMLFYGISAMGRDEKFVNYILRVIMAALFNFTLGVCGAVVAFIFGVYGLIQTYRPSLISLLIFFGFSSIAAISFALTWLIGLYVATAGTVYVGAKFVASNMRLEGGAGGYDRRRVR